MSIAVRARGDAGAVTVADVNLKFIWDVVTRIKIGKKGKAYVVDGTGHLVADPDIGLVLRKTDLSSCRRCSAALEQGAEDSQSRWRRATARAPLCSRPTRRSSRSAGRCSSSSRSTKSSRRSTPPSCARSALIAAGLLISALVAMWLARSMVRPIRTLQEGAARIGAGDLDQKIDVRTGDELEALANQFNQMSAQSERVLCRSGAQGR